MRRFGPLVGAIATPNTAINITIKTHNLKQLSYKKIARARGLFLFILLLVRGGGLRLYRSGFNRRMIPRTMRRVTYFKGW
jgi:hypothetical protein